jgi:hypothetical protein
MWNALKLRDQMKSCYSSTHDYSACATQITAESSGLPIGSARGQVEITQAHQPWDPGLAAPFPGYTIVAHSLSGTDFTHYVSAAGASATIQVFTRCSQPHRGFCGPEGFWSDLWSGIGNL